MSIDINLNVNVYVGADKTLMDALVYAGGWAASLYKVMHPHATKPPITNEDVNALKENCEYPRKAEQEQAEKPPAAASDSVPKVDAGTSTPKAKTDAPAANPAPAAKAEAKTEAPAPKTEAPSVFGEPDKVVSDDGLMQLRAAVLKFGTDDSTGENRKKLRAWLDARGFEKVTDVTNGKAPELIAYIEQELAKGDEGKEAAAHA